MKYNRSIPAISRDNSATDNDTRSPSWLNEFISNLEKSAVQPRNQDNFYDQLNGIINSKSKYSSVEEAIKDMQVRTGLYDLLNKKANSQIPQIFLQIPQMQSFIDNFVKDRPGIAVEAVVQALMKINEIKNKIPENDVSDDVKKYISDKISENKALHPEQSNTELGKLDKGTDGNSVDDPFSICMPSKK